MVPVYFSASHLIDAGRDVCHKIVAQTGRHFQPRHFMSTRCDWPAVRAFQLARAIKPVGDRISVSFSEYPHRTPGGTQEGGMRGWRLTRQASGSPSDFAKLPGRDARIHPLWPEARKAGSRPGRFTLSLPSPSKSSDCSYMPTRSAAGTATPSRYAQLRDGAGLE
jgi:hypothetical protein